MTFVVCVSADKYVAPPLLIIPVKRLNMGVLECCDIECDHIITAPKGFISSTLFLKCIKLFSNYVPDSFAHLFILVYDCCFSHYNDKIVKKSFDLKGILVILPANATHLIQPLDIAVFLPFKTLLKHCVSGFLL